MFTPVLLLITAQQCWSYTVRPIVMKSAVIHVSDNKPVYPVLNAHEGLIDDSNETVHMKHVLSQVVNTSMHEMVHKLTDSIETFIKNGDSATTKEDATTSEFSSIDTTKRGLRRKDILRKNEDLVLRNTLSLGNTDTLHTGEIRRKATVRKNAAVILGNTDTLHTVARSTTKSPQGKDFWDYLVHSLMGPSYVKPLQITTTPSGTVATTLPPTRISARRPYIPIVESAPLSTSTTVQQQRILNYMPLSITPAENVKWLETVTPSYNYIPLSVTPIDNLNSMETTSSLRTTRINPYIMPDNHSNLKYSAIESIRKDGLNHSPTMRSENIKTVYEPFEKVGDVNQATNLNPSDDKDSIITKNNITFEEANMLFQILNSSDFSPVGNNKMKELPSPINSTPPASLRESKMTAFGIQDSTPNPLDDFLSHAGVIAHGFVEERGPPTVAHNHRYDYQKTTPTNKYIITGSPLDPASSAKNELNPIKETEEGHPSLLMQTLLVSASAAFAILMFGVFGLLIACYRRPSKFMRNRCPSVRNPVVSTMEPIGGGIRYHPRSTPSLAGNICPTLERRVPIITPYYYESPRSESSQLSQDRHADPLMRRPNPNGPTGSSPSSSDRSSSTFRNAANSQSSILY